MEQVQRLHPAVLMEHAAVNNEVLFYIYLKFIE